MEFLEVSSKLRDAFLFAYKMHKDQERKFSGRPYIEHPEFVTAFLSQYTDDEDILTAAMLHDTVEDTEATLEDILELFGDRTASLVGELTCDTTLKKQYGKRIYMAIHFNELSSDAFLIKLADRLHNLIGLDHEEIPIGFVKWYVKETNFVLDKLDREVTKEQQEIINFMKMMLFNIEFKRKL